MASTCRFLLFHAVAYHHLKKHTWKGCDTDIKIFAVVMPTEEDVIKCFLQKLFPEPGCQMDIILIFWQIFSKLSVLYSVYTQTNVWMQSSPQILI